MRMFKNNIIGLEKIFMTDIPQGGVIIVTGTAGSLKSAFVYNLLSNYLSKNKSEKGVYVTLEETRKSHLKNMKSLGISLERQLKVSDIASFREHIGFEHMDYFDLITKRVTGPSKSLNYKDNNDSLFVELLLFVSYLQLHYLNFPIIAFSFVSCNSVLFL